VSFRRTCHPTREPPSPRPGDQVDDAAVQYATNVDQLQADFAVVQAAATAAQASPAGETLTVLGTSIRALVDGVTAFADDVRSTC
jgi:hypothetical protein